MAQDIGPIIRRGHRTTATNKSSTHLCAIQINNLELCIIVDCKPGHFMHLLCGPLHSRNDPGTDQYLVPCSYTSRMPQCVSKSDAVWQDSSKSEVRLTSKQFSDLKEVKTYPGMVSLCPSVCFRKIPLDWLASEKGLMRERFNERTTW